MYEYIFPPMWPNGSFCALHRAPISGPGPALSNSWPLHGSQQHPHGAWRTRAGCPSSLSRLSCRFCGSSLFSSWSCPEICGRWSASLASLGGAAAHPLCNLPGAGSPHWTGEWGRDILASSFLGRISSPFMLIIVLGQSTLKFLILFPWVNSFIHSVRLEMDSPMLVP